MSRGSINEQRRNDIRYAQRRIKGGEKLTLTELAMIWGTSKARFVTVREAIDGFPAYEKAKTGNEHLYPAKEALDAMLAYEMRHDAARKDKALRQARMIEGKKRRGAAPVVALPADEMLKINRLATEAEEREIRQRELLWAADVQRTYGLIFAKISTFIASLRSSIDPNGELPAEMGTKLDERGREALLGLHGDIKGLLSGDGNGRSTPRNRKTSGRARGSGTPRRS